jgi:transposase
MCLHPHPVPAVPAETARIAQRAFRRGHPYLKLRDAFGSCFDDTAFAALFSPGGQAAAAPWRLALVAVLQFAEGLSDRQAADAVRGRLEWKYLLALELDDPGFDASVLTEFRARLLAGGAELLLFETLLTTCREHGLVKARGKQRTDSTHVLAAIRRLNRLELVGETLRQALDALAVAAPEWLLAHGDPAWAERYGRRFTDFRLPRRDGEREALAHTIGADGAALLAGLAAPAAPPGLAALPEVERLRQVWEQQYTPVGGQYRWCPEAELPPAPERLVSPHDPEARCGKKGSTSWVGYKRHVTETCDPGLPRLITDVQTTAAPVDDAAVLPAIQAALAARQLLPAVQLVDAGYTETAHLLTSQAQYQIDLVGPLQQDTSWQARAGQGFAARDFAVDWEQQRATCPGGKESVGWQATTEAGRPVIKVRFAERDCRACPLRERCTRATTAGRGLTLPAEPVHRALAAARTRQETAAFATTYAARAGVEGSHSQAVRRCDARQSRYVGQAKTQLQDLLTATAINFLRVGHWLMGQEPARTRVTRFGQLATGPS